jgi:hypothetical protein
MAIEINGKEFSEAELAVLAKAGVLSVGAKNDPASTTATGNPLHGTNQAGLGNVYGTFSYPGVRPEMWSALPRARSFLRLASLEAAANDNERIEVLTGQTADAGTNATGFCGNPPSAGNLKVAQQLYTWGDYYIKTELNALAQTGSVKDRADMARRILNSGTVDNPFIPDLAMRLTDTQSALQHEFYKLGVSMERQTELVSVRGTAGTKNSTYIGWFTQFGGLDGQIATGKTDVITGTTAPALDSAVISFNANISGNGANGLDIVENITAMVRGLQDRASSVGINASHAVVMRKDAFYALCDVFACNYATYQCDGSSTSPNNRDGMLIQNMRNDMLNGRYLLVSGQQIPVVFSDGILQENTANNTYKSDIYVVAYEADGVPLLRLQYFDMGNSYINEFANAFGLDDVTVLNNGLFIVGKRSTGLCIEYHVQARMRLILDAPFLSGRVDDAIYTLVDPIAEAIPGVSNYRNGGITRRL